MTDQPEDPGGEDVTVQPTLPSLELPDFEGLKPVGVLTNVTGTGQRIHRAMHLEERVVVIIEAEVSNVAHRVTDDGIKRVHTLKARDLYELEGKAGKRLLRQLAEAYRLADDQRHGRAALPFGSEADGDGIEVTTDDHGHVLTPTEIADRRGLDLDDASRDPLVAVFNDGSRLLWPDDYPPGADRPGAGQRPPGADDPLDRAVYVVEILDADTGETVETWTDDQEDELLELLERKAAADEAREDIEAGQELQRARKHPYLDGPGAACQACGLAAGADQHWTYDRSDVIREPEAEPVDGYAEMTADQVRDFLGECDDLELVFVTAAYEEEHKARKGVLEACARRAGELTQDGGQ